MVFLRAVTTEEKKQQFIDEYYQCEGILIDRNQVEKNPSLRALANNVNVMNGKKRGLIFVLQENSHREQQT